MVESDLKHFVKNSTRSTSKRYLKLELLDVSASEWDRLRINYILVREEFDV